MELSAQAFLDKSLELSKTENIPQVQVILFNVKHLEGAVKNSRSLIKELRVAAPLFEEQIRPLKVQVRDLSRLPATPENCEQLSKLHKRLNILRALITQCNVDISTFRKAVAADHDALQIVIEALREYYKQNPDEPAEPATQAAVQGA